MSQLFNQILDAPVYLQVLLIALATFLQEDVAALLVGLAVANEDIDLQPAAIGVFLGALSANLAFWLAGRLLGPAAFKLPGLRGAEKSGTMEKARIQFKRSGFLAILASRFLPGTRIPVCAISGILGMSFPRYLLYSLVAVVPWTVIMLWIPDRIEALAKSGMLWWLLPIFLVAGVVWWKLTHKKSHPNVP
jgi:membrane protein DedA with SNARE-associated domain